MPCHGSLNACVPLSEVWRLEIGVIWTFLTQQCFKGQILGDNSSHFLIAQLPKGNQVCANCAQYSTPRYSSESKSCFRVDSGFWLQICDETCRVTTENWDQTTACFLALITLNCNSWQYLSPEFSPLLLELHHNGAKKQTYPKLVSVPHISV